ncbi:ATP-grasp domain-containing protein [Salininema proteolyticum]|uniref:ATP-grasp domain-containing protein n=1 Tax=Salininema proteolyticum TaxID=1607685 RepID=A0ABV8TTL7_9ACTN
MQFKHRIAVVGGRPAPVHGARELGIDVVLLHGEGQFDPREAEDHVTQIITTDITDTDKVLAALEPLHRERPFDRILTTTELSAVTVGEVNAKLGLPGTDPQVSRTIQDKYLTRAALEKAGLSPVRYRVVSSVSEAEEFLAEVGGRIVLKPSKGAGSFHINMVDEASQIPSAFTAITEFGFGEVLAEEFLDGPIATVEAFSHNGRHVVLGTSEYQVNEHFVEWAISSPADLPPKALEDLSRLTGEILDAVGLENGPSHSEFVLTGQGPRLLETHNRLSGSGIPELVHRSTGWDPARLFLTVPLGVDELPDESPEPAGGAAIRYLRAEPGTVESVEGLDGLDAKVIRLRKGEKPTHIIPHLKDLWGEKVGVVISKSPGDVVSETDSCLECDRGYVVASAADRAAAERACREADERIAFRMSPGK